MGVAAVAQHALKSVRHFAMSSTTSAAPVLEGVFAINKPAAISSAQVIRDVQGHFDPSALFKPWLAREQARKDRESHNQKQKRKWRGRRITSVKMGHGGTLDPMATGVLILGLGSGTKQLHHFSTECTKSYETVVLFGAATDSYDTEGKVVSRKAFDHITKDKVETALAAFRGKIMQQPPIFSALRVKGKRLYEYAREGKEVPVKIEERPVEVHELELLEWMEGGTHPWHWPQVEAEQAKKRVAEKVLHLDGESEANPPDPVNAKRKRSEEAEGDGSGQIAPSSPKRQRAEAVDTATNILPETEIGNAAADNAQAEASEATDAKTEGEPCPAPACRLRMTVTSGFYVRSLCHDLGAKVDSLGIMANLVRTRQGEFELGKNVLEYDDLLKGEDVWSPQVKEMLENWEGKGAEASGKSPPSQAQHKDEQEE